MRVYNSRGDLLGDDGSTGVTDPTAPVGSPDNPLQLPDMSVTGAPATFFDLLMQPPYVYFIVAGIALAAYFFEKDRHA